MSDYRTLYKQTCYAEPPHTYDEESDEPLLVFYMEGDTPDIVLTENDLENMLLNLRCEKPEPDALTRYARGIAERRRDLPDDLGDLDERTHAELLLKAEDLYDCLTNVTELYTFADAITRNLPAAEGEKSADPLQIADTVVGKRIIKGGE